MTTKSTRQPRAAASYRGARRNAARKEANEAKVRFSDFWHAPESRRRVPSQRRVGRYTEVRA